MKFALAGLSLDSYPPVVGPVERTSGGAEALRYVQKADSLSWDWLTIPEHVLMPRDRVEHMGTRFVESIVASAVLMGATKRIHMLTYILPVAYRHPLLLAKQVATMEFLAGGRFTLGAAVGHLEKEFEALNIQFEKRGQITDEYIRVLKEAWTSDAPSFDGEFIKFRDVAAEGCADRTPRPGRGRSKPRRGPRVRDCRRRAGRGR